MAQKFPQAFGPYTLHQLIARGGMAEIYRATMPGIGTFEKVVAIKKILPHLTENEEFITMLIDEAQILVGLNHANIAQVYDLGTIDDSYYIAMEYVHGLDISGVIKDLEKRNQYIPYDHTAYIVSCLCMGLHVAHHASDKEGRPLNIVHRDISPHNVLISFAGDVKVIDFGVAKARSKNTHTKAGVIKGKLLYMAPEQAMAKDIDGRSDLFAAGLVMYKMLTRELPFSGDNEFQIYNNILTKEIVPPKILNPEIPEELNQICMTLLQREPEKRYQTGYAAKQDLTRALHHIKPGYTPSRLSRFIEDNFSHIVRERQQKAQGNQNGGGQKPAPPRPATPPAPQPQPSPWDNVDNGSTLEQPAPNFGAMGMGGQQAAAERVRTHTGNQYPQQNQYQQQQQAPMPNQRTADPGQFATPVPGVNDSGHNAYAQRISTPANGYNNADASFEGNAAGLGAMELPPAQVPPADNNKKKGIPPILFAVLAMGLLMTGLLAYVMFFSDSDTKTPPDDGIGTIEANDSKEAAPESDKVANKTDGANEKEVEEAPSDAMIAFNLTSEPEGAEIWSGEDKLGNTPLSMKLPGEEFPLVLEVRNEGYKSEKVILEKTDTDRKLVLAPEVQEESEEGKEGDEKPAADTKKVEKKPSNSGSSSSKTDSKTDRKPPKDDKKPEKTDKDDGFIDIDFSSKSTNKKKDTKKPDKAEKKPEKKEKIDDVLEGWN